MNKAKYIPLWALLFITACSDKNDPSDNIVIKNESGSVVVTIQNINKWKEDAKDLVNDLNRQFFDDLAKWQTDYAQSFKAQNPSANTARIIGACADCADEIANEKIPHPIAVFTTGDDCLGYIGSIRNSIFGSIDGTIAPTSFMALLSTAKPSLAQTLAIQLQEAAETIKAIPQPLAANASSPQAQKAISACQTLSQTLRQQIAPALVTADEQTAGAIINAYVDNVIVPSVTNARTCSAKALAAMQTVTSSPTQDNITAAVNQYIKARAAIDLCQSFPD